MSSYKENEKTKEVDLKDLESNDDDDEQDEYAKTKKVKEIDEIEEDTDEEDEDDDESDTEDDSNEEDDDDDNNDDDESEVEEDAKDEEKEDPNDSDDNEKKVEKKKEEKKEEPKKKNKKNLYIIIGSVVAFLILLIILLVVLFLPKDKKEDEKKKTDKKDETTESQFVLTINKAVENGNLVKEINKALNDSNIKTENVYLISLDIDKDNDQELMAYAEDSTKKYLLQFEVTDEITYEDSFQLDSKDSMGYTYSVDNDKNYFYTNYSGNYTIIERQKKVIKEEDFMNGYFVIANTYKKVPILNNAIKYDLSTDFDAKDLEEKEINEKTLLKDNDISETDVRPAAEKYFKEKKEAEEKKKKEEEEKKKAEEEAKKKEEESTVKIEGRTLHFGKYIAEPAVIFESITINKDMTAKVDDNECKWFKSKHNFTSESTKEEDKIESITIMCKEGDYYLTSTEDDVLTNGNLDFRLEK